VVGVAVGVAVGIAVGIAVGVVFGVAFSVFFGVTLGFVWVLGVLRVYFWLPELLWMLFLALLARQGYAAKCLPYLPPRFDELIHLPLPFMDGLIVEAYTENPAAARQTIDYLIASTNQQKVAAFAMTEIAVNCLNKCQTLNDIAAIAEQLAWIPSPPPPEVGELLPQFLDLSQIIRAATTGTSAYRQTELFAPPITALTQLQNSLAFSKDAAVATTFGSIAQRWLGILQAARRTLESQASQSAEIPPAYIAGAALDPETAQNRFKGRADLFREIEDLALAAQPPVLFLQGGRRTGKTSALKYLPQKVGAELVPLLIDLQGGASSVTLFGLAEYLAQKIVDAAQQSRNLRLELPDTYELERDPFRALQKWFEQVERTAPNKRFLLCLDEFERLSEVVTVTGSRAHLNFLSYVMQHRRRWIVLFSGSHTLDELDSYWSDYLINTRSLRLSYLQPEDARELILHPVAEFPEIYTSTAVNEMIHLTHCQPFLLQLMGAVLVDRLNQKARETGKDARTQQATVEDVRAVIPQALEVGEGYFRELWRETLTAEQRDLLLRLVGNQELRESDRAVYDQLVKKEVLSSKEGSTLPSFQVPLVEKYIKQYSSV